MSPKGAPERERECEAGVFDPRSIRFCSILPDCDADEAYCVRHERDMPQVNTILHHDGALFTTSDGWGVYSCPDCMTDFGSESRTVFQRMVVEAFDVFDDTDTEQLNGAFRYIGETEAGGDAE